MESLRPTGLHKFYRDTDAQWVSAKDLSPGDRLSGADGPLFVRAVQKLPGTHRVYNLTIEGEHVYRVSNLGVLVHNMHCSRGIGEGTLTASEHAEILRISRKYNTTIDVVGSRAAGEGRRIYTNLPVGKSTPGGPPTRSDIDFRVDTKHPRIKEIMAELREVGGGAGSASLRHGLDHRPSYPPFIRFPGD